MFDQLINLVKEHAGEAIIKNPAIPNEQNDAAIKTAASGIMDQFKNLSPDKITDIFKNSNVGSSPEVGNISSNVAGELMKKFGINKDQAGGIVKMLIPVVISSLIKKTNDPNDKSFDLKGIIGSITSGKAGGISDILGSAKNMFGK